MTDDLQPSPACPVGGCDGRDGLHCRMDGFDRRLGALETIQARITTMLVEVQRALRDLRRSQDEIRQAQEAMHQAQLKSVRQVDHVVELLTAMEVLDGT